MSTVATEKRTAIAIKRSCMQPISLPHLLRHCRNWELWCTPTCIVTKGAPAAEIMRLAGQRKPDLIILGAKNVKSVMSVATHLSRATAQEVIANAPCPVLTVRAPKHCERRLHSRRRPGSLWKWPVENFVAEFEPVSNAWTPRPAFVGGKCVGAPRRAPRSPQTAKPFFRTDDPRWMDFLHRTSFKN
jgi:hypothetical protein